MVNKKKPAQSELFDPFGQFLDERVRAGLDRKWYGTVRHVVLGAIEEPVAELARHFDQSMGAPTKDLYAMAALLLVMEFNNWTVDQAVEQYTLHAGLQYALGLAPYQLYICSKTIKRYRDLARENGIDALIFASVTEHLVRELDQEVGRQRLDSTHVLSDMATFGRTQIMRTAVQRFLRQVRRHDKAAYESLPEALLERQGCSIGRLLAEAKGREGGKSVRQQVAEDMLFVIERFERHPKLSEARTYKLMVRVFHEQCELVTQKVEVGGQEQDGRRVQVRDKTGGDVIQNTSDPDASYDGHKGAGYKVQIAETCSGENEVQLIVAVQPQTAVEADAQALAGMVEQLEGRGCKPGELLADGAYGSDRNACHCAEKGIELVSPANAGVAEGKEPKADMLGDFECDPQTGKVIRCPAGHRAEYSDWDDGAQKLHVSMARRWCARCELRSDCPVQAHRNRYVVHAEGKRLRLAKRRRYEGSEEFRERYKVRSGIEGTNSGLKRRTGLGRLRVRGAPRVFYAVLMKCAGWNVLRATASGKLQAKLAGMQGKGVCKSLFGRLCAAFAPPPRRSVTPGAI